MNKISKKDFKSILSSDKARKVITIIGLCAIAVIFVMSQFESKTDEIPEKDFDTNTYQNNLTREILDMVQSVEGAGKAKVMLTLENSYEYVYLDDDKTLRKVNEPTIRGVVVACEGGDSPIVTAKITELLRTVLNVPGNKVCVSKLT